MLSSQTQLDQVGLPYQNQMMIHQNMVVKGYYTFEFLHSFYFNIVVKFAITFSLVFISFINIFFSFSLVFILWTHFYIV